MIASLFRALEDRRVRYLLIGGQACVLYGGAQLTEDVDLWIHPTAANFRSFLQALASANARVYKVTPPLQLSYLRKGHGFHFVLGRDLYLDVMGKPPRVGSFAAALRRCRRINTDWGLLPVVSPEDLVLLKQTNRPSDYETISNLVRMRVEEDNRASVLRWALLNTFDVEDLASFAVAAVQKLKRLPLRPALRALLPITSPPPDARVARSARLLALEAADVQERGRRYWLPYIEEIKALRAQGKLVPQGTLVSSLI